MSDKSTTSDSKANSLEKGKPPGLAAAETTCSSIATVLAALADGKSAPIQVTFGSFASADPSDSKSAAQIRASWGFRTFLNGIQSMPGHASLVDPPSSKKNLHAVLLYRVSSYTLKSGVSSLKISSLEDSTCWSHTAGSVSVIDREKPDPSEAPRLVGAAFGRAAMFHAPRKESFPLVALVVPAGEFGFGVLRAWFRQGLFSKPSDPYAKFILGMAQVQTERRDKFIRVIFNRVTRDIYCELSREQPDVLTRAHVDLEGPSEMEIDACSMLAALKEN
jgi:hypothetical protein